MRIPFISVEIPPKKLEVPVDALIAGAQHLIRQPGELLYAARHAAALRAVIPLDAVRWLLGRLPAKEGMPYLELGTRPPALTVVAKIDFQGNRADLKVAVRFTEIELGPDRLRIALRLSDFEAQPADPKSPLAALLAAPSLKEKPASLLTMLPRRPDALVEAVDDRVVIDLMKLPKLAQHPGAEKALAFLSEVMEFPELVTEADHLLLSWRPKMDGLKAALATLRR